MSAEAKNADIAWAAGLFEGEGTFIRQTRNGRTRIGFALATTDLDVLERFTAIVGAGAIAPSSRWGEKSTKPIWRWSASAHSDVCHLTDLFWPWLGNRRRNALERTWLDFASQPDPLEHWRHGQTHCKRGHEFTPENTRIEPRGSRRCRACDRLRSPRHRVKRTAIPHPDMDDLGARVRALVGDRV